MLTNNKGFTLLELLMVVGLIMAMTVIEIQNKTLEFDQHRARALGKELYQYNNAVQSYIVNNPTVTGTFNGVNWLKDTSCGGLASDAFLPCSFSATTSLGGLTYQTQIVDVAGQSEATTTLPALVYKGGIRPDLAGLAALTASGGNISGPVATGSTTFRSDPATAVITMMASSTSSLDIWLRTDGANAMHAPIRFDGTTSSDREINGVSRIFNLAGQTLRLGNGGAPSSMAFTLGDGVFIDSDLEVAGDILAKQGITALDTIESRNNIEADDDVRSGRDTRANRDVTAGRNVRAVNSVIANNDVQADDEVIAGNRVRTLTGDVQSARSVIASLDSTAGRDMAAGRDVRAGRHVLATNGTIRGRYLRSDVDTVVGRDLAVGRNANVAANLAANRIESRGDLIARGNLQVDGSTTLGGDLFVNGRVTATGNITSNSDVVGNRFLDRNNTYYRVDPASTSILNDIRPNTITSRTWGTSNIRVRSDRLYFDRRTSAPDVDLIGNVDVSGLRVKTRQTNRYVPLESLLPSFVFRGSAVARDGDIVSQPVSPTCQSQGGVPKVIVTPANVQVNSYNNRDSDGIDRGRWAAWAESISNGWRIRIRSVLQPSYASPGTALVQVYCNF